MLQSRHRPAKRRLLYEEVADAILEDIKRGLYPVGSNLPAERELMAIFSVGRPSVREAISKLNRLGIIELKQGMRPKVCKPDVTPVLNEMKGAVNLFLEDKQGQRHLQQVRFLLECSLTRFAAINIKSADLRTLKDIVDEQAKFLNDHLTWAELDVEFHKIIAQVPNNPILITMQQSLASWLLRQSEVSLRSPHQPTIALEAHQKIYEALRKKDPDLAENAMTMHLEQVYSIFNNDKN